MFDKRVKEAREMLKELEDEQKSNGIIGNLIGGFITILVGTALISEMKNGQTS